MIAQIHPHAREQFEAARVLRTDGWSFFRISAALGISLTQVRVACDSRASELHEQWSK